MKLHHTLAAALLALTACETAPVPEDLHPADLREVAEAQPIAAFGDGTWQLVEPVDADPLWRIVKTGDALLLQTDPSVTSWGTDYWGYWTDAYHDAGPSRSRIRRSV